MTVKIKYVGDRDEVTIAATFETVQRRGVVEVPRDIADELVRSGDFKRVVDHKPAPKAKATTKAKDQADETPEPADDEATDDTGAEPEENS